MAANVDTGSFLYEIRIPVLAAILWAILGTVTPSLSGPVTDAVWLAVRFALFGIAGYLVTRRGKFGLWHAALAGVVVMLADHVLVKGLAFLADMEAGAAAGVVVSFLMFFWVAAAVGAIGGVAGKAVARRNAAI
jgi:hypothetical protein